ncbi:MAG: crtE [Firmicutes bacterium]|nr:crtE [Bacillota bacterium]
MFEQHYQNLINQIEAGLDAALPPLAVAEGGTVVEASRYSLLSGGKRIRPVLLLATLESLGLQLDLGLPYALAIEMIHTYSLIHDDLPCMDDDDFRRGRPTCHKQFGEALAVLAGDTLLNRAFEIVLDNKMSGRENGLKAAQIIARSAGSQGMIAGQALDLAAEGRIIEPEALRLLHSLKTGRLIAAPVLAACALAGAAEDVTRDFQDFAENLGLAFQIQDDILDVTATSEKLGKTTGKDSRDLKSTYVTLFGLDQAQSMLREVTGLAKQALQRLADRGYSVDFLFGLTEFLLTRDY